VATRDTPDFESCRQRHADDTVALRDSRSLAIGSCIAKTLAAGSFARDSLPLALSPVPTDNR
jgi:hypothetical protein